MYRQFTVKDKEGKTIKFRVWPDLAKNVNKLIYQSLEIELSLVTNRALLDLVDNTAAFMNENTINKLIVEEIEEGVVVEGGVSNV